MTPDMLPTGNEPALPGHWAERLQTQLTAGEKIQAWLELDLDQRLQFSRGLVAVTDHKLYALAPGETVWQSWPLQAGLTLTHTDHAGVGMLELLDPQPGERIADMFCGLGNFTLPIARLGATVVGIEGSEELVKRAGQNAEHNGLRERVEYGVANLFEVTPESLAALGHFDKMLIDPPREGSLELVKAIGEDGPKRIVYVSCNPATLARDAAILVTQKGYRLRGAGVVNMFPNTSHVESIALFERGEGAACCDEGAALSSALAPLDE